MYAWHKYISSTCSEGFRVIHSTTSSATVAHFYQNIFKRFIGWTRCRGSGSQMVSQIMDLLGFFENGWCSGVPSTPTTKNYAANEVSRPKSFPRKKYFFCRKSFFAIFFICFDISKSQILRFCRFWRPGDVSVPTIVVV